MDKFDALLETLEEGLKSGDRPLYLSEFVNMMVKSKEEVEQEEYENYRQSE